MAKPATRSIATAARTKAAEADFHEENVDYDKEEESKDDRSGMGNNNPPENRNPNQCAPNPVADVVFAPCPGQVNPNRVLDYEKAADIKL